MINKIKCFALLCCFPLWLNVMAQTDTAKLYHEPYRLQVHFSPQRHWTNDPNGMVYYKGIYHLFYQYYPGSSVWGPMHWGHAESKDLVHWKELPIALYPDSLGYIFSGSAVVDINNTSGFGKNGKIPLVAIFTHHDPNKEKAGRKDVQTQSIAYSLDEGKSWTKYKGNPVVKNPGITDFRDPKVMWYAPQKKWIMTLATKDRVTFFSSPNLKDWKKESDFGKNEGAHGGVWECPDLFTLQLEGKTYWIVIANINPGAPNGGSGTQYFVGNFDGKTFTPQSTKTKWLEYGPDDYAGITWSNTGGRKIFLGWMSNWLYANKVPTEKWRNGMTIPRDLALKKLNGEIVITSTPVKELAALQKTTGLNAAQLKIKSPIAALSGPVRLKLDVDHLSDYSIILSNDAGEQLVFGYDKKDNRYFLDRSKSGKIDFNPDFKNSSYMPRFINSMTSNVDLIVDTSSIEVFADGGLSTMTAVFFSTKPFDHLEIKSDKTSAIKNVKLTPLKSIWK